MTEISASIRIDAPKDEVWAVMADFGGIWQFNPSVNKSYSLTEANHGVGAERRCELTLAGASVDERIVEWSDAGSMAVEIYAGKKMPPIKNVIGRLEVREDGAGSVASGTMTYDTKFGPIGWAMDKLIVSKQFEKAFTGIFAGLKHHVETGEAVERGVKLPYELVMSGAE